MMSWETVIGLEVHVQLSTRTKAFCGCESVFGAPPNTRVCPVCLGLPGALPVLNDRAVDDAVLAAQALGCEIAEVSIFARKNYFYPDLPKGYQISQYDRPLASGGCVPIDVGGEMREIELVRIHLEEDAGKSLHAEGEAQGAESRIDLNRCGTPLIEIVSTPSLRRAEEAGAYLESLRRIVQYLGISDGDMSQGSLRCDANVSVRKTGASEFGTKTEVKNLNSIKMVEKAIQVEARRQIEILEKGGKIEQATLLWDDRREEVRPMRKKEDAHDYRYFPEPDLMPLVVDSKRLARVRERLLELPFARRARFVKEYDLPPYDAGVLTASRDLADWFEEVARASGDGKAASNWTMGEVLRVLKERGGSIRDFPIAPVRLAALLRLVRDGKITTSAAKSVFGTMLEKGESPEEIVEREGLAQISDTSSLEKIVDEVIRDNAGQVETYRSGKSQVFGYLMGQVMKASRGKANPQVATRLLEERLKSGNPA
jgi:aspartyl-tRNA(Asn)/glutamyl-tRNA(Gln) amidotransferase subunit B